MQLQREGKDEERRKRDRFAQIEGRCSSRRSGFLIVYRLHAEDEEKEEEESNDDPGVCAVEIGDVLEPGLCKHTCRPLSGKGHLTSHLLLVGALTTHYILSMILRKEACILKQNERAWPRRKCLHC